MGFLSGVLEGVKDDDAVKTYDNYMPDDNKLEEVLEEVNNKIGSGRTGLAASATLVKEWLEKYWQKVHKGTNSVKDILELLLSNLQNNINVVRQINTSPDHFVAEVSSWSTKVMGNLLPVIYQADSSITKLDNALRTIIHESYDLIEAHIHNLDSVVEREQKNMMALGNKITGKLNKLKKAVEAHVESEIKKLESWIVWMLEKLHDSMTEINHKLIYKVAKLDDWIASAKASLDAALAKIEAMVKKLEGDGPCNKEKQAVITASAKLYGKAKDLWEAIGNAKRTLTSTVAKAAGEIDRTLKPAVIEDLKRLRDGISGQIDVYFQELEKANLEAIKKPDHGSFDPSTLQLPGDKFKKWLQAYISAAGRQNYEVEALRAYLKELQGAPSKSHLTATKGFAAIKEDAQAQIGKTYGTKEQALNNDEKYMTSFIGQQSTVETRIKQIETDVNNHFKKFGNGQSTNIDDTVLRSHIRDFTDNIKQLCERVVGYADNTRGNMPQEDGIHQILTALKDVKINSDLSNLSSVIDSICKMGLKECINTAKQYADNIKEHAKQTIILIHQHLSKQITHAVNDITQNILARYKRHKEEELNALKNEISSIVQSIAKTMDDNLQTGVKGFLKTLADGTTKNTRKSRNIDLLKTLENKSTSQPHNPPHLQHLAEAFHDFCQPLHNYLLGEITRANQHPSGAAHNYSSRLDAVYNAFSTLLPHLREQNKYDHRVPSMLSNLRTAVAGLKPDGFSTPNTATLDCITSGLTKFADELDKAYISVYDGHPDTIDFSQLIATKPAPVPKEPKSVIDNPQPPEQVLTPEGEKLCKVFCTLLEILLYDFTYLKEECSERWKTEKLCQNDGGRENPLGIYLQRCGYLVAQNDSSKDGELRCHEEMKGEKIYNTFIVGDYPALFDTDKDATRAFQTLADCLNLYYQVCHYSTLFSKKHPSSINQMLTWFSGLPHSPVYDDLSLNGFGGLFEKHDEEDSEDGGITIKDEDDDAFSAYPEAITATKLRGTLTAVCTHAHSTLTAILGHGHAGGTYAVDFNTNTAGLAYPANLRQCLDLLVELALRLYHQLCFLHVQCSRKDYAVSWRDCYYGRYVAGSDWRCNDKQCINQMVNQSADQKANQTCGQTCDQHPKCGLKSPLQSFLEDGLAGFLPHPYSKANCKLSCDMANHRGLPCKTPMGFGEISVKASHTQKGEHIAEALADFCGKQNSPLVQLCAQLTCLLQRVPQTLDDLFSFYYNILNDWDNDRIHKRMLHRETALEAAVTGAYFGEAYPELDITPMFKSGEKADASHSKGNVLCVVNCNNTLPTATCGRYLLPLSVNTWSVYSEKNADKYLSWIVYLTETFYQWLQQLYNECCNNCNKPGSRCYGKVCSKSCPVKSAYASDNAATNLVGKTHTRDCKSIANCPSTRPTLCRYGFVFNSSSNLSGAKFDETKRTCNDLCQALQKVLSDKEADEAPLAVLIYKTIPQFLWDIRSKFFWLNVALWLLSLLYLLHIMVIRLDLLHIKSHLHSPSSHRIAAQSLLAAGRVNKPGRVFYLQP